VDSEVGKRTILRVSHSRSAQARTSIAKRILVNRRRDRIISVCPILFSSYPNNVQSIRHLLNRTGYPEHLSG